jgi:outer membrane protein OmpA-like peptidoglycan-associated protein
MRMSSLGLIILSGLMLSACSSTPDRYAFWRDGTPSPSNGTESMTTSSAKPNLGDIPAAPDVTTARQEMENLQTKLAADRQSAYQQAQSDNTPTSLAPRGSAVTVSDPALLPLGADKNETTQPATFNMANIQAASLTAPGSALATPAMINPNRDPANPGLPVYMPQSVQVNRPVNPLPQQGEIGTYIYGRSGVQYRQNLGQQALALTPPSTPPADNNKSITVDMSALGNNMGENTGGNMPRGGFVHPSVSSAFLNNNGAPVIYFNHGSSRLSSNDRQTLSAIASKAAQGHTVKVIGHASKRAATVSTLAAKEANLKISATRAAAVMKELAKNGVNAKQIEPIAVGDGDARQAPNEKAARRVDIIVD